MSEDLVKRLRGALAEAARARFEAADRIEQLERELAEARKDIEFLQSGKDAVRDGLQSALTAQMALADRLAAQMKIAEAALSDIGDAEREEGDDLQWCEQRAPRAIPETRAALSDHRKARGL